MKEYENELYDKGIKYIAGVDEVGRGPLIGNVVCACVILPKDYYNEDIKDSKKLSEKKREMLYDVIMEQATKRAMKQAIDNCNIKPEHVLIDAVKLDLDIPSTAIIKGDAKSQTIAAASIIAKVTRDRQMIELSRIHPEYDLDKNKGYGTKKHIEAIKKYGLLKEHRKTFTPCNLYVKK